MERHFSLVLLCVLWLTTRDGHCACSGIYRGSEPDCSVAKFADGSSVPSSAPCLMTSSASDQFQQLEIPDDK